MKIAVVGCGALGSFYGAKLGCQFEETHFLLRSDYSVVQRQGVDIRSINGDFHFQPRCARLPQEIGICDLVIIGLKTTANQTCHRLLPPLVGPRTLVVTLQNGLGNEGQLAALFGPANILGGLCFVCLNRLAPGLIQHTAHGHVVLGEYQRPPLPRTQHLADLFVRAGVPCTLTDNLERAHWQKLVWNVPFNGLGVAGAAGYQAVVHGHILPGTDLGPCLTTDILLADPRWERLIRLLMEEVIATANSAGFALDISLIEENIQRTRCMGAYRASTLVDFERHQPIELDSLFLAPLRYAQRAGIKTPQLEALSAVLTQLSQSA
jgi:2-dehydropantoate 2-reductase